MKNLLSKELRLCLTPQVITFICLSALIAIPSWPALTSFIYTFLAIVVIFPVAIANRDIEFTSLLPVRKVDIVKGKVLLACFIELCSILVSIPFALLKFFIINPALGEAIQFTDLGINLVLYGIVLAMCGFFNLLFIPMYYKNPFKMAKSQFISTFVIIILTMVMTAIFMIDDASAFVNSFSGLALIIQFVSLGAGIALFVLFNFLAFHFGAKKIKSIDL
ncbi:MAG: ABC-2 transporter permease [Acholeplasmataceae bacterium]